VVGKDWKANSVVKVDIYSERTRYTIIKESLRFMPHPLNTKWIGVTQTERRIEHEAD
jgi:hypothetical protein